MTRSLVILVLVAAILSVVSQVNAATYPVSITLSGLGIVVSDGIIACTADVAGSCSVNIASGTILSLYPSPVTGQKFSSWSGACTGSTPKCTITVNAAKSLTATFVVDNTSQVGCTITRPTGTTPTYAATHPKVFLNHQATFTCLKSQLTTTAGMRWKNYVMSELSNPGSNYGFENWQLSMLYKLNGDAKVRDFALKRFEDVLAAEEALIAKGQAPVIAGDSYLDVGPLLQDMAMAYDYLYDVLSTSQKSRALAYMNQALTNVWRSDPENSSWGGKKFDWSGWGQNDPYNNYYYSFLRATMFVGLATNGDGGANPNATHWLSKFRDDKLATLLTKLNSDLPQGGSLEGTGYGTSLKEVLRIYDYWERSTGEKLTGASNTHAKGIGAWMLHSISPDTEMLYSTGDQARDSEAKFFDYHREMLMLWITLYPSEPLSPLLANLLSTSILPTVHYDWIYFADFMTWPPAPQSAVNFLQLSTTYYGTGHGMFYMRSSWVDPTSTYSGILCGANWQSHQHREQGAFELYRGDWLAPTGTHYTPSGINQRTQGNNLVRYLNSDGTTVQQNEADDGNTNDKCTMKAVVDKPYYIYASTSTTPIYSNNPSITKSEREFLFVKPSTFFIFDRAVTKSSAGLKRSFTINFEKNKPVSINGDHASFLSPAGTNRLDIYRTSPTGLSYTTQTPVWGDEYGPDIAESHANATWLNVIDTASSGTTYFLHVLSTSNSPSSSSVVSVTAAQGLASGFTGATVVLADGRTVTGSFSNTGSGGHLTISGGSGSGVDEDLAQTVTIPPVFLDPSIVPPPPPSSGDGPSSTASDSSSGTSQTGSSSSSASQSDSSSSTGSGDTGDLGGATSTGVSFILLFVLSFLTFIFAL